MPRLPTNTENFQLAALRHMSDARCLLGSMTNRDGAAYLAGYAAECSLKRALFDLLGPGFNPRDVSHNLAWMMDWLVAVGGSARVSGLYALFTSSNLGYEHPMRRYWPNTWTDTEATEMVELAEAILASVMVDPLLDTGGPFLGI